MGVVCLLLAVASRCLKLAPCLAPYCVVMLALSNCLLVRTCCAAARNSCIIFSRVRCFHPISVGVLDLFNHSHPLSQRSRTRQDDSRITDSRLIREKSNYYIRLRFVSSSTAQPPLVAHQFPQGHLHPPPSNIYPPPALLPHVNRQCDIAHLRAAKALAHSQLRRDSN